MTIPCTRIAGFNSPRIALASFRVSDSIAKSKESPRPYALILWLGGLPELEADRILDRERMDVAYRLTTSRV